MQVILNLKISRWLGNYNRKRGHITNPVFKHFIKPQKDLAFLWEKLYQNFNPAFLDTRKRTHLNLLDFIICITFYWLPCLYKSVVWSIYQESVTHVAWFWIYQKLRVVSGGLILTRFLKSIMFYHCLLLRVYLSG